MGHPPPTKRARVEGGDVEAAAAAAAAAEGQGAAAAAAAAAGVAPLVEEDAEGAELRRIRENELQVRGGACACGAGRCMSPNPNLLA